MTCITGETGAGKSILMGGLGLVLGKRADLSVLKDNKKKCVIEASFLIGKYNLKDFFDEAGLDYEEETLLRREIIPNGKSRAFINDTPVNLDLLGRLSEVLIDVHSQLENQSLFKNEYQFLVLDAIAGNQEILKNYRNDIKSHNLPKKFLTHEILLEKDIDLVKYLRKLTLFRSVKGKKTYYKLLKLMKRKYPNVEIIMYNPKKRK